MTFNDKEVVSSNELPRIVASVRPGTKVPVQVWRKGAPKALTVEVGETPDERGNRQPQQGSRPSTEQIGKLGLSLAELPAEARKELNVSGGVLVENAEGVAARAGIRRGDVILAVNNVEVKSVAELTKLLTGGEKGRTVALLVKRGQGSIYIPLKLNGN